MHKLLTITAAVTGAVTTVLMLSHSASALSCARPDLVRTLEEAKASPKIYYVLVGRFISLSKPTPNPMPNPSSDPTYNPNAEVFPEDPFRPKPPMLTKSYFEGVSLAPRRRNDYRLSNFPVDIETSCIGPWCSNAPDSNQELIAFVEARDGQAPILRISPCPSQTFSADREEVQKVRQCLDKRCESDWPQR